MLPRILTLFFLYLTHNIISEKHQIFCVPWVVDISTSPVLKRLIAKPLYILTENLSKFEWTVQCQEAFEILKKALVSSSILSFAKGKGKFILDTDASNIGIGAILSQE